MGQISRVPQGFLDLLGGKTLGKTPPQYVDALSPTLDLGEFYMSENLAGVAIAQNHTIPLTVVFTVPNGELWILRSVGASLLSFPALNAFERWQFRTGRLPLESDVGNVANPSIDVWTSRTLTSTVIGQGDSDALVLPKPIYMLPGQNLLATLIQRDATALRTTSLSVLATILKA